MKLSIFLSRQKFQFSQSFFGDFVQIFLLPVIRKQYRPNRPMTRPESLHTPFTSTTLSQSQFFYCKVQAWMQGYFSHPSVNSITTPNQVSRFLFLFGATAVFTLHQSAHNRSCYNNTFHVDQAEVQITEHHTVVRLLLPKKFLLFPVRENFELDFSYFLACRAIGST